MMQVAAEKETFPPTPKRCLCHCLCGGFFFKQILVDSTTRVFEVAAMDLSA